jgi:hypothetical protein
VPCAGGLVPVGSLAAGSGTGPVTCLLAAPTNAFAAMMNSLGIEFIPPSHATRLSV